MRSLSIHYLQHVPFEGLAAIQDWIQLRGHHATSTLLYEKDPIFPDIDRIDWLLVMGGPMGINEENVYPWLVEEKKYIKKAIQAGKTVIGICLGAQLIANVLGAKVYPNKEKEIGWYPITFTDEAKEDDLFSSFPKQMYVFHWHGDTFDLPFGAIHLAESEVCKNQLFRYGDNVLGLQFHFEMNETAIMKMIQNGKEELINAPYIMEECNLIHGIDHFGGISNFMLEKLLDQMAQRHLSRFTSIEN